MGAFVWPFPSGGTAPTQPQSSGTFLGDLGTFIAQTLPAITGAVAAFRGRGTDQGFLFPQQPVILQAPVPPAGPAGMNGAQPFDAKQLLLWGGIAALAIAVIVAVVAAVQKRQPSR